MFAIIVKEVIDMQTVKKIRKALAEGEYNETLTSLYGAGQLPAQLARYEHMFERYDAIYGDGREVTLCSVPYSLPLYSRGAELAAASGADLVAIVSKGMAINITRLRAIEFDGEDNTDFYQKGPFREEVGFTSAVLRGILVAFKRAGVTPYSSDIILSGAPLPGNGLDSVVTQGALLAAVYNATFAKGRFTNLELAEMVRWALANYCGETGVTTAQVMASLCGGVRAIDFAAGAAQEKKVAGTTSGIALFEVALGEEQRETDIAKIEQSCEGIAAALGKESFAQLEEAEFYAAIAGLKETTPAKVLIAGTEYFTRKNLAKVGAALAVDGEKGAPAAQDTPFSERALGGAAKWRNACPKPHWAMLCAVDESAAPAFEQAMAELFGMGCVKAQGVRGQGFTVIA